MRKIGIMGGTFNPIHTGHLLLAEWAMEEAGLEEVWVIPAGITRGKAESNLLDGRERLHMAELAVQDNQRMCCMDVEIRREGYTYTYETLEELQSLYPEAKFYFIAGADCLLSIEKWKCPEEIFRRCTLIAAVRDGTPEEAMEEKRAELLERYGGEIILLPFVRMSVSSSEIRRRRAEGKSIRYMVPESVRNYIEEKGFYRG